MNAEDENNTLHPWIEPELEARLTALVLGEASDFERDELERLVADRPELGLYRKRLETMHRMLREVASGESAEEQGAWKLGAERRATVLARLGKSPTQRLNVLPVRKRRAITFIPWSPIPEIAATLVVVGLALCFVVPISNKAPESLASPSERVPAQIVSSEFPRSERLEAPSTRSGSPLPHSHSSTALADHLQPTPHDPISVGYANDYLFRGSNASVGPTANADRETRDLAIADQAIRPPVATTATPARPADTRVVTRSGQTVEANGTVAVSGGDLLFSTDPNPQVNRAAGESANVRVGGDFDARTSRPESAAPYINKLDEGNANSLGLATVEEAEQLQNDPFAIDLAQTPEVLEFDGFIHQPRTSERQEIARREEKLKTIILPSVEFDDTPLKDAIRFLEERSAELDTSEPDPSQRGVRIALDGLASNTPDAPAADAGFGFESSPQSDVLDTKISLRLSNVPLAEALRYTTSLAQTKFRVGTDKVEVVPLSSPDADLYTSVYTVPPTFLSSAGSQYGPQSSNRGDPFADPVSAGGGAPSPSARMSAKAILENAGVVFPKGSSVVYNAETSQLIVRNSQDQMELVEALIESIPTEALSNEEVGAARATPDAPAESRGFEAGEAAAGAGGKADSGGFASIDHGGRGDGLRPSEPRPGQMEDASRLDRLSEADQSVQDILALTPQLNQNTTAGGFAWGNLQASTGSGGALRFDKGTSTSGIETLSSLDVSDEKEFLKSAITTGELVRDGRDSVYLSRRNASEAQPLLRQPTPATPAALAETSPVAEPFSTFSLHVSDVSFQLAKAALASGQWPEVETIRIEEFVNAFDYGDPMPAMEERVAARIDQAAHPFLQQRNLVRIALRTAEAGRSAATPLRLTLLLDSSGSMERPDRRETVRRAVATLAGLLGENDRITLVSFARQPRLVADAVPGNEARKLAETAAALPSEGGTNLEAALQLAFEKAREHREVNAQNRIVLLTDGAANLGDAKAESLASLVEGMREAGIAFDAAGFGAEGLNDEILEALTRKGDGRYYLLDRPEDAEETFAKQIAGALRPAAKNVKVQVEFNPDRVKSYKLLGFEKHRLATEDFRNDAVDAAELAAAEAGVAVYQVEPNPTGQGDLGAVSVRFRDMDSNEMVERRWSLPHLATAPSADEGGDAILLATVASQFAAKLAGGPLGDLVDLGELARLAAELPDGPRVAELRTMIEQARGIEGAR